MKEKLDFSGLGEPVSKKLAPYLKALLPALGDNLNSIVVYGSAVAGEFDPRRSNINLIVVVEKLDLEVLHRVQPLVKRGARDGIVAPLLLTHEHMRTSSDVFPIEFLDMSEFHHVVWGQDPFSRLEIGRENLRLECEEKLKGTLINLRQSYLEIADRRIPMMRLVATSITSLASVFRGLLRLQGKSAPARKDEVIREAAGLYPLDAEVFCKALEIKHEAPHMTRQEMDSFFARYLADIERLALYVDKMGKKSAKDTRKRAKPAKVTRTQAKAKKPRRKK